MHDFSMEYEEGENSVPGNIPEFGAVFMSNAETKRECFKRRVFALPSSMAGFVKQIKAGMVLFLFEFEKRQLYGVYKATSDGALNILPNAFRSGGKQFPSQVCFTPIWLCSPLSENEFQSAIHENYYSARKFKFGLSEDQVRRLLHLFSTRKLNERSPVPPRQHNRTVSPFSSKGRNQIGHGRFSIREDMDMELSKKDFTRNIMNEYLENIEDRGTKTDDIRFYIDNRINDEESLKSSEQRFLTDHADDSLHKKRKISYGGLETDEARASPLPFGTDSREASMHKERMPAASGHYLGAEDRDDGWNTFNSPPAFRTRYPELPFNFTNTTDERHYPNDTNRIPTVDRRFLVNDITTTEPGSYNARRPVISNEQEHCLFDRPGKIADDCEFPRNSKVGHNHHLEDGIAPVFPSESFDTSLHRVRETAVHRRPFTNERVISEHDPDRGQVISPSLSRKVVIPLDSHERKFDEQRFPRNNLVKANCMEGHDGSVTLNMSSGYDTRLERQNANDFVHHIGTLPRPVISTKSSGFHQPCQSSQLECFTKPSPDGQFPGFVTESQNVRASSSMFHDSLIIRSRLSDVPSAHHVRNMSFATHQGARVAKESLPHHSEVEILGLSKGKSFEAEASNTYKPSCFSNKVSFRDYNYSGYPTDEVYDDMDLKSPSSADYKGYRFSPANLRPFPSSDSGYFDTRDNNILAYDDHGYEASQGMQKQIPMPINDARKYIHRQENDDGNEHMSSYANLSEFDMCYSGNDPLNRHLDRSREYRTYEIDDNREYYGSTEGPCSDHGKQRRSVFSRLTSGPKLHHKKQEDDAYFYDAPSVDDVMDMLHQNQRVRMKNSRKFNSVVRQHDKEEEKDKNNKKNSFENQLEHGHPKTISVEIDTETNPEIQQVIDDKPKETRMVEFKRRREVKRSLDDKTQESTLLVKEDSVSEENEKLKGPLGKHSRRRVQLPRPPHPAPRATMSTTSESTPLDNIFKQKKVLRTKVRRELKSMDSNLRSQEDDAIQNIVLEAPWFRSCKRLCAYISCSALREVDTSRLLAEILENSSEIEKKLYVPRVEDKNSYMRMLNISRMDDLIANTMNILEPDPTDGEGNEREDVMLANDPVDLLLLPGLAFDKSGRRLGRGGGYYDAFLSKYLARVNKQTWKRPLLVALSYSVQILDECVIPVTPNDVSVDALVTASGVIPISQVGREFCHS